MTRFIDRTGFEYQYGTAVPYRPGQWTWCESQGIEAQLLSTYAGAQGLMANWAFKTERDLALFLLRWA